MTQHGSLCFTFSCLIPDGEGDREVEVDVEAEYFISPPSRHEEGFEEWEFSVKHPPKGWTEFGFTCFYSDELERAAREELDDLYADL